MLSTTSSPSNVQLIIDALANYAKITGIDLPQNPFASMIEHPISSKATLQLLREREKAFKEYHSGNPRQISWLGTVVNVLHGFSGVLGEAVSLVPMPPANALFVGIDVLLDAASEASSYNAVFDLFECLGYFLRHLEIYTTIPPTPIMTDIVVKIIVELLSVLALATNQMKQGQFKKFTKKLLLESEINTVLLRLNRLTLAEARMTVVPTLGVVRGLVGNITVVMEDGKASTDSIRQDLVALQKMLNDTNKMKRDQLQRDVQKWLSPPDPSTNHNFLQKARHNGTAAWFFESNASTKWRAGGSFLWIHGISGAGKSTLLSEIIQDIWDASAAGLAIMAFYYFDFQDVKKQDCYGLLSSLISQLAVESDSFWNILTQLYSGNRRDGQTPDIDALKKCMKDMLCLPGQGPIYIIIDALDECPNLSGTPSARGKVLELIEEIVDLKLPNVHLCVASRLEMNIRMVLGPLTSLRISLHDESGHKEDIIGYIKSVVHSDPKMRRWRKEDQNLVIDMLSQNADGVFQLVVYQFERLRRCFPASIRRALAELPLSLDETYEQMLLGIDREKLGCAQRLFKCLSVSIRPLRVEDLAEILAIDFEYPGVPSVHPNWRPIDAEDAVLSVCSGLVDIVDREGSKVVQFSHISAREFLTRKGLATSEEHLPYYHILPELSHATLAYACLSVLLRLDDRIDEDDTSLPPLALYAARHWVDHAQFKNVSAHVQEAMEYLFDRDRPHFAAWVSLYDIDRKRPQPVAVPLYYASLFGLCGLMGRLIVSYPPDVNSRGGLHTTPLHAASFKGYLEAASLLLECGADPNSQDTDGFIPLQIASKLGHVGIVRLLLDHGSDVNVRDTKRRTLLHLASRYGHNDLARLLVDRGADVDTQELDHWTALHLASRFGHLDIAQLLIDHGANVNSQNDKQRTPLDLASMIGQLEIVHFLIERGADVCAPDDDGWTPFHTASYFGNLHVAKFLLRCGIDVDIRNKNEQTALYLASRNGKIDVVRFLIEQGADNHVTDNNSWNPVHIASHNGHLDVVHLLINIGVPVHVLNGTRKTPLALASKRGKVEVGRFLIEQGADVNARDKQSRAPLHLAAQYGHFEMAALLLDNGVDPNVQKVNLWSPLHLASAHGHLGVTQLLIQRGAKIDLLNGKQDTPLHLAAGNGQVEIARLLIDHGANLHIINNNGWTPLDTASRRGHLRVVILLLRGGADVHVLNKANKTAAESASENGQAVIKKFIAKYKADAANR